LVVSESYNDKVGEVVPVGLGVAGKSVGESVSSTGDARSVVPIEGE